VIPDRQGFVRVRASFPGSVDLRVRVGEAVYPGRALVIVEGAREVETLSARNPGYVREILVEDGVDVAEGTLLLIVEEIAVS